MTRILSQLIASTLALLLASCASNPTGRLSIEAAGLSSGIQAVGQIDVGFSPDEGAEQLVLKVINSAQKEVRVLSYSFTSAAITSALIVATKRGVDVALIVDYKNNVREDRSGKAHHALSALVNAGARVRTIADFPIHHDKTIIVDGITVETGSFNFSEAAAHRNSENVIVNWNNPKLAEVYLKHWADRFNRGKGFEVGY